MVIAVPGYRALIVAPVPAKQRDEIGLSDFCRQAHFYACICSRSVLQLHHDTAKETNMKLVISAVLCVFDAWIWLHNLHIILGA